MSLVGCWTQVPPFSHTPVIAAHTNSEQSGPNQLWSHLQSSWPWSALHTPCSQEGEQGRSAAAHVNSTEANNTATPDLSGMARRTGTIISGR